MANRILDDFMILCFEPIRSGYQWAVAPGESTRFDSYLRRNLKE